MSSPTSSALGFSERVPTLAVGMGRLGLRTLGSFTFVVVYSGSRVVLSAGNMLLVLGTTSFADRIGRSSGARGV